MPGLCRWWVVVLVLWVGPGWAADEVCAPEDSRGVRLCRAGLPPPAVANIVLTQSQSQWCWAASLSMVLAHHGAAVPQEEVVRSRFAGLEDRAATADDLAGLLARRWPSNQGHPLAFEWRPLGGASPASLARLVGALDELRQDRPVILGARGHLMVLVAVAFERYTREDAIRIVGGTVIDPAPGAGVRALRADEMRPTLLAAVARAGTD